MAGFFGFFDYTKPGRGVEKEEFTPNLKTFFRILSTRFWKLVQLNLLYVICSLPLIAVIFAFVPIGGGAENTVAMFKVCVFGLLYLSVVGLAPVTAGFTYVLRNFTDDRHAWVLSDFFEHIKKNFKQASLLFLIDLAFSFVIPIIFNFYTGLASAETQAPEFYKNLAVIAKTIIALFTGIYFIMHFYIYQIMITFNLKLRQILRNSLIFALSQLPRNIAVLALIGIVAVLTFGYYTVVGVLVSLLIVPSLVGYIINFITQPVVKRHMITETNE